MTREEFIDRFLHPNTYLSPPERYQDPRDRALFTWDEFKEIITGQILPLEYLPWLVRVEFLRLTRQTFPSYYGLQEVYYHVENREDTFGFHYVLDPFSVRHPHVLCDFGNFLHQSESVWRELGYALRHIEMQIAQTMRKYLGSAFSEPHVSLEIYRHSEEERQQVLGEFGRKAPPLGDPYAVEIEVKSKKETS